MSLLKLTRTLTIFYNIACASFADWINASPELHFFGFLLRKEKKMGRKENINRMSAIIKKIIDNTTTPDIFRGLVMACVKNNKHMGRSHYEVLLFK